MAWWNPRDWFKKDEPAEEAEGSPVPAASIIPKPGPLAYVRFRLDRPFDGVFWHEPTETPWILVEGLDYEDASLWLPNKSLDWGRIPLVWRESLERGPGHLILPFPIFKEFVK